MRDALDCIYKYMFFQIWLVYEVPKNFNFFRNGGPKMSKKTGGLKNVQNPMRKMIINYGILS